MQCLDVACHDLGGRGPTLLMLHANGFHGRTFLPMLPTLAPHFHCLALDLPGHGDAPAPEGPFYAEDLLAAVRRFVEERGLLGCYCLGHSLGGVMAALLQLERPGTFKWVGPWRGLERPGIAEWVGSVQWGDDGA
ncbi:hypothetical protein GPECTOR_47g351 [Gonium pectorale]|uniref:AB hydrolase-1 domain-containing protein n=1 Tax=Gonium pectorale TaxID=33097 RepID=A0A150G890_GONPE|nr:hypothetical protein GPECTOR_47g351 [Gonium pectorale]|eukprot:KXZ46076.1 hypothetical protein GPECTOR_47g351 [Gonium pectorale]